MDNISIEVLINIKQGDKFAFKLLYETFSPLIFDLSYKILKDREAAEEIVQDCFLRVWINREQIDLEKNIWAFIYLSAKRLCFNRLRDFRIANRYLNQIDFEPINDIEQKIDVKDLERRLQRSINNLPEQQKKALNLSRVAGYSHNQIAQEMGISPNTVKNHISQALKSLRKSLVQANCDYILFLLIFFC